MKNPILDDNIDRRAVLLTRPKMVAYLIILIGIAYIYSAISHWYAYYHPSNFVFIVPPEIAYPIQILAGVLLIFCGIQLFLNKVRLKIALSAAVFIGIVEALIFVAIL